MTDAPDALDAPASSSTKNVAPPVKSKKKSSPLDICKDRDALFALLSKMIKEDEAANSDDEKSS